MPKGRKGMTIAMEKSLSRITFLRVVSKILAREVHHILVLLRVVMELFIALWETFILVALLAIKHWDFLLNYL